MATMRGGVAFPFHRRVLGQTELNLAFFIAFLLLEPTVRQASTILNYETHVKYLFKEEGCAEEAWATPFLKQIRKGLRNTLPTMADKRKPLLLPLVASHPLFETPGTNQERLLRFATILGFIGMLRPNALTKLSPDSFMFVTARGRSFKMPAQQTCFQRKLTGLRLQEKITGFHIDFRAKTMRHARAHFPNLCTMPTMPNLVALCPVRAVVDLARRRLIKKNFLKALNKGLRLTRYLKTIAGTEENIAPYALRIGGRTWLISTGMDRQFVDYLGRWKSPEASARYFRAAPREVLRFLRRFYFQNATAASYFM